jgi:hypothetical protein
MVPPPSVGLPSPDEGRHNGEPRPPTFPQAHTRATAPAMLRSISTSRASLGDLLTGEELAADREDVIDLLFAHATGTPLSLVRSAEQLADLHLAASRRIRAEVAAGVSHLADAFAALMRGSTREFTHCAGLAGRAFADTTTRRRETDPFTAAVASSYLGVVLDLTERPALAVDAYEDAYSLYQAAEFRAMKEREANSGLVARHLGGWPLLGDVIHAGRFYDALWRWCDAAERLAWGRALVRPALAARRPAAITRVDWMGAEAARRKDRGACMLCGGPMGFLARARADTVHRGCAAFRA